MDIEFGKIEKNGDIKYHRVAFTIRILGREYYGILTLADIQYNGEDTYRHALEIDWEDFPKMYKHQRHVLEDEIKTEALRRIQ